MKTVFFDVDTQLDFLYPAGALSVPEGEALAGPISELTQFAVSNGIPIVSTVDAHTEDDPEFQAWPPHCVVGTLGQAKASFTRVDNPVVLPNAFPGQQLLRDAVAAKQVILQKQNIDCFTSVALQPLLSELGAERYVVYGVVAEVCVAKAVFGLLKTGKRVELVLDGTKPLDASAMQDLLTDFQAEGGIVTDVAQVTASHAK
jgi:nicotinamidase/pyrazinamidase